MKLKMISIFVALFVVFHNLDISNAMFNSLPTNNVPYYAYVLFHNTNTNAGFYGGGCIISTHHVLTSGSNVHGWNAWQVSFGSNRRNEHTRAISSRGIAHPQFVMGTNIHQFDIGIIFIDQPIQLTPNVFPISMSWKTNTRLTDTNIQGLIVGFAPPGNPGTEGTNVLQAAHVRIIDDGLCRPVFPQLNPVQHFCAVDEDRMSNFCDGDQGGPLAVISRGREVLIGIGSFARCGNGPSTYTRIDQFRDWIHQQTGM